MRRCSAAAVRRFVWRASSSSIPTAAHQRGSSYGFVVVGATASRMGEGRQHSDPGTGPRRLWRAGGLLVQFAPEAPERVRVRDLHPGDAPEGAALPEPADDDDAWREVVSLIEDAAAPEYFAAMLHAWRTGDVAEIDRILREESGGPDAAPLLEALLDARNVEMAEAIERGLKPGRRPFIAVGAGHIGGKGGLLEILAARGYALRQVHDAND